MKIKEEHLDKNISCPYTGKTLWVRTIDKRLYNALIVKGYGWLFEYPTCPECLERIEDCECETSLKKKRKK